MNDGSSGKWLSLNEALATLALLDETKPLQRMMGLLRSGQIKARGDFEFKTFREDQHFQSEGTFEYIAASRWEALAMEMEKPEPEEVWLGHLYNSHPVTLAGELDLNCNGFRLAATTGEVFTTDTDYSESWLSVWEVHIWEAELMQAVQGAPPTPVSVSRELTNTGGRPPKANWEQGLIHLFGKVYRDGWKPDSIETVNGELQNWLVNEGFDVSDTASCERARALFRALKAWDSAET